MPMDFLRRIEGEKFPFEVTAPNDIRNAAVLVAAGLIDATVPHEGDSPFVPAVVARITCKTRSS